MTESHIDYDAKVQNALRSVVKTVLEDTEREGLQGDHHFYIAFKTQAEGVDIPAHLVSRFPDEMTIVLQHKFWGLTVTEDYFEIGLSFNQKPEHLHIPFAAIVGFVDPSVQFALQFHDDQDLDDADVAVEIGDEADNQADDAGMFLEEQASNIEAQDQQAAVGDETQPDNHDNVVTLDAFRKK